MESNSENNIRSSIQRFPVELLAEIFLICVSPRSPPTIHVFAQPPLSLSRVCRSWREVALNLPRLWTAISVDMDILAVGIEGNKLLSDSIHQWFARASHFPLTFHFKFTGYQGQRLPDAFNAFVAPFAHRLRHLYVDSWIHQKLFSHLQFPEMEAVIVRDRVEVCQDDKSTPLFPFSSRLRRVRVDHCVLTGGGTPAQLVLPWNQLTHLFIDYDFEVQEWRELLRMCLNLQHGVFGLCGPWHPEESPASEQYVVLHHLVELTINFFPSIDVSVFSPLKFPALETLRIETQDEDSGGPWVGAVHCRFFQQLFPLRRLSLGGFWGLTVPNFKLLLKAVPHVVELDLQLDTRYQDVFSCLQLEDQTEDPLLPNLKVLIVELTPSCWDRRDSLEVKIISDVVQSRVYTKLSPVEGNRLERLVLFLGESSEAERGVVQLTDELQPWVDDGFRLELKARETRHWSERLDPAPTEWHEGLIGL